MLITGIVKGKILETPDNNGNAVLLILIPVQSSVVPFISIYMYAALLLIGVYLTVAKFVVLMAPVLFIKKQLFEIVVVISLGMVASPVTRMDPLTSNV